MQELICDMFFIRENTKILSTWIKIQDKSFFVDIPFPYVGQETTVFPDSVIKSIFRYVNGFEIHVRRENSKLYVRFFLHDREIPHLLDSESSKILVSYGKPITVNKVHSNTQKVDSVANIPPQRIKEGAWTILAPENPEKTIMYLDYPQGYKEHFWSTKFIYPEGYEIWMANSGKDNLVHIWFYKDDVNIVPIADETHFCLTYPELQNQKEEKLNEINQLDGRTTILFLAANPTDTRPLRLDQEFREIDQILQQTPYRDRFEISAKLAVRSIDLQGYLLRYKPQIIHFSGHGGESGDIILEDSAGNSSPVSSQSLGYLFSILSDNIRCVFLNSCYSERQAQAIANNVDCVIGMTQAISDPAAINFARAFYQALGYGRDVKTAFDLGCSAIDLQNLPESDTPKLLSRVNPSNLFL